MAVASCRKRAGIAMLRSCQVVAVTFFAVGQGMPQTGPIYGPWETAGWEERVTRGDARERGVRGSVIPINAVDSLFWTIPEELRVSVAPSASERATALGVLQRVLHYPFVSSGTLGSFTCYKASRWKPPALPSFSYQCSFTSGGVRRTYRISLEANLSRPSFGLVHLYVDGLDPMKSAEDVTARIRELFTYQGELIAEPPLVPSPRTFKIRSLDGNWHFRGGQITLVSTSDRSTTTAVNALAAEIKISRKE